MIKGKALLLPLEGDADDEVEPGETQSRVWFAVVVLLLLIFVITSGASREGSWTVFLVVVEVERAEVVAAVAVTSTVRGNTREGCDCDDDNDGVEELVVAVVGAIAEKCSLDKGEDDASSPK